MPEKVASLGFFEKYIAIWVFVCIAAGILVGQFSPGFPKWLSHFEYYGVSLPVAILLWLMIYPLMVQIDFSKLLQVGKKPKGLIVTLTSNWIIAPVTMFALAYFFLKIVFAGLIEPSLADQYLAGAILLGVAPCTAMVFVWSYLVKGDANYTLVQVAINDLILIFAYAPLAMFFLGVGNIIVPYDIILASVVLYLIIPLTVGFLSRRYLVAKKGEKWFNESFSKKLQLVTVPSLLLTLIIIFSFQGEVILSNPLHILLISVPLVIQTFSIFWFAHLWAKFWKLPHNIAAPAAIIGTSSFFELAVAVAITLFGLSSGAALATVVGVIIEVPVMLLLVWIANRTRSWFPSV